jgi:hypothetical protein
MEQKYSSKENQSASNPDALAAVQANIRRYGWQALIVRLTAIILGSAFILYSAFYIMKASPASFRIWPVVCLFLLWMLDGHCKFMQQKYVDLYHAVLVNPQADLAVKVDNKFNVVSLWRPLVMVPYVVLIGLIALANLGF